MAVSFRFSVFTKNPIRLNGFARTRTKRVSVAFVVESDSLVVVSLVVGSPVVLMVTPFCVSRSCSVPAGKFPPPLGLFTLLTRISVLFAPATSPFEAE